MKTLSILYRTCLVLAMAFLVNNLKGQPCTLAITATGAESRCKATGSITVTASNGSGSYNYTVSSGSFSSTTSSNVIQGLKPGYYLVKVKDISTGCSAQVDSIQVGGNYQDPRFQLSVTDVTCINGSNGSITVTGLQYGRAPFSYAIVAPSASGVGTSNNSGVFTNLTPGNYSIQLRDSCGGIQTRVITIANYDWNIDHFTLSKIGCTVANIIIYLKDNKGNVNTSGTTFSGYTYGVVNGPGDTTWTNNYNSYFFIGNKRSVTLVAKDNCGNVKSAVWNDVNTPSVNATVSTSAFTCSTFTATITGQSNLTNPQYCIYDNLGNQLTCNSSGQFTGLAYGSYCIKVTDNCYDTVITRCFSAAQPVPAVDASVSISNLSCSGYTATVTGQQNLNSPQYCLKDSANNVIACNTTGVFNNVTYGDHCITITDGCNGTVLTRCFTQKKAKPVVSANVIFTNQTCTTVTASISGQSNITNGQYCIYDGNGVQLACNTTGVFNNLAYGSYCIHVQNDPACYDTMLVRCFTASPLVPSVGNTVSLTNYTCNSFTASINGQTNLTNPQYCLYDNTNTLIICNSTGVFNNLAYGSYCIQVHNDGTCYDTTMQRCFTANRPVPSVAASVAISNQVCTGFTASITGQTNLTTPQYCLYDNTNTQVACNTTGQFNNLAYGSYCIYITNTCYDTTITRCFTVNPVPMVLNVSSAASCSIGTTTLTVNISNGTPPYTINIYNPGGVLVNTTSSSSASNTINGLSGLPSGFQYKVVVSGGCGAKDSINVTPIASSFTHQITTNAKCPGGAYQNGSGDLVVNAQFSGGPAVPTIITKDGTVVNIPYSTQTGTNYTFTSLAPATYIIQYALSGCGTIVNDTFALKSYTYPTLNQSAVYQCNNNNYSVNAAVVDGLAPFTYEIIGSTPSAPSIVAAPQASPTFAINNGTTYSVVRLRAIDACGNATINDAGILPIGNTKVSASSDCFYNNVTLSVDTIPNATYSWYKKNSPTDSTLIASSQTYTINYMLPGDTGTYVSVVSVNSGCLTKIATTRLTGSCGSVLAQNGLSFSGSTDRDNVQLVWNTVKAYDAVKFTVERSNDGDKYAAIGTVTAAASNEYTASTYLFTDMNASAGKNFYRLRIQQASGKTAFSNVLVFAKTGKPAVSVMPNPVAEVFTIRFQNNNAARFQVNLVAADGKVVLNTVYAAAVNDSKTIHRPAGLAPGVYFLLLTNQATNEKEMIKLFFK